jgi:hypothetical protein
MKSLTIKIQTLQPFLEHIGKKVKQWRHYLPIINLALFTGVVILLGICIAMVYYPPDTSKTSKSKIEPSSIKKPHLPSQNAGAKGADYYDLIQSNNPFSPDRTPLVSAEMKTETKKEAAKHEENIAQSVAEQQKPKGTQKPINLVGIMILGDIRKALIENPDRSKNDKSYIFIEEGEEIVEYKVKAINEDQIVLDWYGEEKIFVMRSNIKK